MCFRDNSPILRRTGGLIETPVFYEHLSDADNLCLDFAYMEKDGIDAGLVLRQVGLPGTGDRPVSAFSLGMRQRLAIARAIVHRPEALLPLCSDRLTAGTALWSLGFFLCCSILAGLLGALSLWFGFRKRSVPVTIVSAVILVSPVYQVLSAAFVYPPILGIVLGIAAIPAVLAVMDLFHHIENMEV